MEILLHILEYIVRKNSKPVVCGLSLFACVLLIIGLVWLSIASYWFILEEYTNSLGAFISSTIFFAITIIIRVWRWLLNRKQEEENIIHKIVATNQPLIDNISKECVNFVRKRGLVTAISTGLVLVTIYKVLLKNRRS